MKWLLPVAGALVFIELFMGALGCGRLPVRVRGVVIDAATGAPIQGASLLTLFHPETVRDPAELEAWRRMARSSDGLQREDLVRLAPVAGSARADAAGAFEIVVGIGISHKYGCFTGIRWFTERGNASDVARALLVEKEGYVTLVHETKDARWEERQDGEIVGTLDVGTICLEPVRGR